MNGILNINNVHGYLDKKDGTAYLNAEDVARDGRTSLWTPRTRRFGTSCDRSRSSGNY